MEFYVECLFSNTVLPSIIKDIFPFSKYFMDPLIWGMIIHNGLIILSSLKPIKCLKPSSLCSNLLFGLHLLRLKQSVA